MRIAILACLLLALGCGEPTFVPTGGPTGRTRDVWGLTFVEISAGSFLMGAAEPGPPGTLARWPTTAQPKHVVTITTPIWVAETEVPNSLLLRSGANAPANDRPAEMTRSQAEAFCRWLTENAEGTFRIPSEAEWEYCCRAGSTEVFSSGDDEETLADHAWVESNSGGRSQPVGRKLPNAWGLYDFHGNVMEWVADGWHNNYKGAPAGGSAWIDGRSKRRVIRGGSYRKPASHARAGLRLAVDGEPDEAVGLRVVGEFLE